MDQLKFIHMFVYISDIKSYISSIDFNFRLCSYCVRDWDSFQLNLIHRENGLYIDLRQSEWEKNYETCSSIERDI